MPLMGAEALLGMAMAGWWGVAVAVRIGAIYAVVIQPWLRRRAAGRPGKPPVSIVIPVKRLEPEVDAAFASVLSQSYPDVEVLVTAAEEESEVIAAARRVASRFPGISVRFLLGNPRFTLNPKVSNLAPAIAAASHDLVLVKDANIRLADGQLAELVRDLGPQVGMVCAVPIGVEPGTFCAEVECAMMNGHAAPFLFGASVLGLDIGFGKVMLFDRRDFARVDGVAVMAPTFGDDHAFAKALARIGLRTVFSARVIRQAMGRKTFREVWDRQLRWMVIRRDEAPAAFFIEPFVGGLFATVAGAIGGPTLGLSGWFVAAATSAAWLAGESMLAAAKGWGWSWRFPLAGICREFLIVALWVRAWFTRKVQWHGRRFEVGGEGILANQGEPVRQPADRD
jgi:ceramide glucosyltransferase